MFYAQSTPQRTCNFCNTAIMVDNHHLAVLINIQHLFVYAIQMKCIQYDCIAYTLVGSLYYERNYTFHSLVIVVDAISYGFFFLQ